MLRLYDAFLLPEETHKSSELVQAMKEHLKPLTQTKQLILTRDTIRDSTNLFCLHDRQAFCLELFTSRILFHQTDPPTSASKKKPDSIISTRVNKLNYKVFGRSIRKHEIDFECLWFPEKEWIKMTGRVFASQSSKITKPPREQRILGPLLVDELKRPLLQELHPASSSYYSSATGTSVTSTEAEESISINGLLMLFINDEVQTLTLTHHKDGINLYTSEEKPQHSYLGMWYSKVQEQYIIAGGIKSGLSVSIGHKITDHNLEATSFSGSMEDQTHYDYLEKDATTNRDTVFTDMMLDFSSDLFTFPKMAVELWLQGCGIVANDNLITKLVQSDCEHSFTFRDGKGKDVIELPLSLMKNSNGEIRLRFSNDHTFNLGRPLLDLYDFSIHRIEENHISKFLQRFGIMSEEQHKLQCYFEEKAKKQQLLN